MSAGWAENAGQANQSRNAILNLNSRQESRGSSLHQGKSDMKVVSTGTHALFRRISRFFGVLKICRARSGLLPLSKVMKMSLGVVKRPFTVHHRRDGLWVCL